MNVDTNDYVPALRWRQGEFQALLRLSDQAKSRVVPLATIPAIEFDFEEDRPKKTVQEHIAPIAKRFNSKWRMRPIWIDLDSSLQSSTMDDGVDVLTHVFSELRQMDSLAVPVASLDHPPGAISAIATIINQDERGVALRVRIEHLMTPNFMLRIGNLLNQLGTDETEVDLIIDLIAPSYEPYTAFANALISALGSISSLNTFRSFVLVGTAIPDSITGTIDPGFEYPRHDWIFYRTLISLLPNNFRRPAYGDYATITPTFVANFDMRVIKPSGKVIYTSGEKWLVWKGGSFRDNRGQMHGHCKLIVDSGKFRGANFSDGDNYIARCAIKATDAGPSTLTRWKEFGVSHHVMHVLEDLSNFYATS